MIYFWWYNKLNIKHLTIFSMACKGYLGMREAFSFWPGLLIPSSRIWWQRLWRSFLQSALLERIICKFIVLLNCYSISEILLLLPVNQIHFWFASLNGLITGSYVVSGDDSMQSDCSVIQCGWKAQNKWNSTAVNTIKTLSLSSHKTWIKKQWFQVKSTLI